MSETHTQTETTKPGHVNAEERNGSITALGILLGFSLTVFSSWVDRPEEWNLVHAIPLPFYVAGVGLQLRSLHDLLRLPSGTWQRHGRTVGIAAAGVVAMVLGFIATIAIDVVTQ
jgi:hypothetical protein